MATELEDQTKIIPEKNKTSEELIIEQIFGSKEMIATLISVLNQKLEEGELRIHLKNEKFVISS